ncbi:MAG: MerR family transcriptional regulator [Caulobacteraceae bacterium]|nr:MerR family transcriptional regulator [Caulobacteraceae bacterium]
MTTKGPNAFRTISEAAEEVGVPQHVLRFWETRFSFIRPMKRAGGRRFYRPQDVAVLQGIKALLYTRGFKIEGVQRLYREQGLKHLVAAGGQDASVIEDAPETHPSEATLGHAAKLISEGGLSRLRAALRGVEAARASLDAALRK